MTELLNAAWRGWLEFTDVGKMAAPLLVSLLFLWTYYEKAGKREFLTYTTVAAACCILPVTAAALMLYQTRIFDYRWIWSIVPLTAMAGFGMTVFLVEALPDCVQKNRVKGTLAALLLLAAVLLCGGLGEKPRNTDSAEDRSRAEGVLAEAQARMPGRELVLWAPREIMEYARAYDGSIRLVYGRDMWDGVLNAYVGSGYPPEIHAMQQWMDDGCREEEGRAEEAQVRDFLETAAAAGVNCILLPAGVRTEVLGQLEALTHTEAEVMDRFYLFILADDEPESGVPLAEGP